MRERSGGSCRSASIVDPTATYSLAVECRSLIRTLSNEPSLAVASDQVVPVAREDSQTKRRRHVARGPTDASHPAGSGPGGNDRRGRDLRHRRARELQTVGRRGPNELHVLDCLDILGPKRHQPRPARADRVDWIDRRQVRRRSPGQTDPCWSRSWSCRCRRRPSPMTRACRSMSSGRRNSRGGCPASAPAAPRLLHRLCDRKMTLPAFGSSAHSSSRASAQVE